MNKPTLLFTALTACSLLSIAVSADDFSQARIGVNSSADVRGNAQIEPESQATSAELDGDAKTNASAAADAPSVAVYDDNRSETESATSAPSDTASSSSLSSNLNSEASSNASSNASSSFRQSGESLASDTTAATAELTAKATNATASITANLNQTANAGMQTAVTVNAMAEQTATALANELVATQIQTAELTLEKGYDWFVVVDRDLQLEQSNNTIQTSMSKMSERESPTKRCGLLGCTTEPYPAGSYGMGLHTDTGDRATKAIASLEIRLGKGVRPENVESYDAREVRDNLSRQ